VKMMIQKKQRPMSPLARPPTIG